MLFTFLQRLRLPCSRAAWTRSNDVWISSIETVAPGSPASSSDAESLEHHGFLRTGLGVAASVALGWVIVVGVGGVGEMILGTVLAVGCGLVSGFFAGSNSWEWSERQLSETLAELGRARGGESPRDRLLPD